MSEAALLRESGPWAFTNEPIATASEGLAADRALLEAVRVGEASATARIWESQRALVTTRREAALPDFEAASRALADDRWPVVQRESGGTAVPHGPGAIHLSLCFRPAGEAALETVYEGLCGLVAGALDELGVSTTRGDVPGSFCDGRYNLVHTGRKIAGTAQRWRVRAGAADPTRGALLAHATVWADFDLRAGTAAVNRFYAAAGSPRRFDPEATITLSEALGRGPCAADYRDALTHVCVRHGWRPSPG